MPKNEETTTKFKVDISELKSEFQQAQRIIKIANSEFKAASAGMDDWTQSADGLEAKIKQLNGVLDAEKTKLASLQKQYELTAQEQGENSKAAEDLLVKLNNQKAAVSKTEKELGKWENALVDVQSESTDARKESDKLGDSLDDVADEAKKAAEDGISTFQIALGNLIADGIGKAVEALANMVTELGNVEGAYNNFQAQTGKTADEMEEFQEQINEIYKNNLGESLEDVADAMAKVAQNTKETDPSKIKELTENALVLRDTFGFEINESMRAVNMLMDQFGITGDEAFNLIVQGAQNGLDKNGDLLDSINEYSVHYQQLGYDADDFFNSLANGTKAGTFSVDKLGDAMKEFGIRTKDTAESTTEGFELVGLNADEMREAFAKGGESAQDATKKTLKALFEMEDEVAQNQAGVALFGTMWEDLGKDGVKALMSVEGELTSTKESMEDIKRIKYDDVMHDISALGREFQMEIMLPIIEKAVPKIREAINWVSENLNTLVPILGTVGAAMATVFVVNKIATFAQSITSLVGIVKGLTTATQAQSAAQTALNATNPFGWVVLAATAVAGLTVGVMALMDHTQKAQQAQIDMHAKLSASEAQLREETNELTKSYQNWAKAKEDAIADTSAEFGYYDQLWDELQGIVDANGKIKEGYEDRATAITTILSDALGTEITITDGVIQKYDELKTSIDQVIASKKAEATLTALESQYIEAIQNKDKALQNYTANQKAYNDIMAETNAAHAEFERLLEIGLIGWAEENGMALNSIDTKNAYNKVVDEQRNKVKGLNSKFADQKEAMRNSEEAYLGFISTIENYEGVTAAIVSGDTDKINDSLFLLEKGFKTAENSTKKSLEAQTENYKVELANLKQAIKDKTPGVTQEQVDQMESLVKKSEAELKKFEPKAETAGENAVKGFADGQESKEGAAKKAAEDVSKEAEKGLKSADTKTTGTNFIQGFINGISGDGILNKIAGAAKSAANWALSSFQTALGEHSPSKKTEEMGKFFMQGFSIGLEDEENGLMNMIKRMAEDISSVFGDNLELEAISLDGITSDVKKLGKIDIGTRQSGAGQNGNNTTMMNFYQTNNSPKALSRLDIYRQTKNILDFAKGD